MVKMNIRASSIQEIFSLSEERIDALAGIVTDTVNAWTENAGPLGLLMAVILKQCDGSPEEEAVALLLIGRVIERTRNAAANQREFGPVVKRVMRVVAEMRTNNSVDPHKAKQN